jgi:hypothetical protein
LDFLKALLLFWLLLLLVLLAELLWAGWLLNLVSLTTPLKA